MVCSPSARAARAVDVDGAILDLWHGEARTVLECGRDTGGTGRPRLVRGPARSRLQRVYARQRVQRLAVAAKQLIEQTAPDSFEPAKFKDTVRERVMETIQRKIDGQDITADVAVDQLSERRQHAMAHGVAASDGDVLFKGGLGGVRRVERLCMATVRSGACAVIRGGTPHFDYVCSAATDPSRRCEVKVVTPTVLS